MTENNQAFASLGHAIADADTNTNLLLKEGEIVPAEIVDVQKGEEGTPGELLGTLVTDSGALGKIESNTEYGLYGKSYQAMGSSAYPSGIQVAGRMRCRQARPRSSADPGRRRGRSV